jgi:taurine dioxygenase
MEYHHITVHPIAGALGAEVSEIDLSRPLSEDAFAEVRRALLEHLVLFFPEQRIPPAALTAFGQRFGTLNVHPFLPNMPEHPKVIVIDKTEDRKTNVGNGWHSDMSFLEEPPLGSMLHAQITPPYGGDTLFASMYLAYEALSDGMRRLLDGLSAVHDYNRIFREAVRQGRARVSEAELEAARKDYPPVVHPVVRTHPETGRKLLFVNRFFTSHLKDLTEEESRPLLEFLFDHAAKPEFTCRYRWTPHAIAFWDNRCTQHYALNDYHGFRRLMHRVTINGDRPY